MVLRGNNNIASGFSRVRIPQEHHETSEISSGLNWVSGTILANIQVDGQIDVLESDNSLVKSYLKPIIRSFPDEEDARFNPSPTETPRNHGLGSRSAERSWLESMAVSHSRDAEGIV